MEVQACRKKINLYGSPPIFAHRVVTSAIQSAGRPSVKVEFLVIPGFAPLLWCKTTAEALGVLHIEPP